MMTTIYGKQIGSRNPKSSLISSISASIVGANHLRGNQPGQDAHCAIKKGRSTVVCVADGHGSAACPHSALGARIAVDIAADFLVSLAKKNPAKIIRAHSEIWIPRQIEMLWKSAVKNAHAGKSPDPACTADDAAAPMAETDSTADAAADTCEPDCTPYIEYGTTLLACLALPELVFVCQIGDGDALLVDAGGVRSIFPEMHVIGEETESLCLPQAWRHIKTETISSSTRPAMVLVSTDGYSNSFVARDGFLQAGADIFAMWRNEGAAVVAAHLEGWLRKSSDVGSGDDISAGIVFLDDASAECQE